MVNIKRSQCFCRKKVLFVAGLSRSFLYFRWHLMLDFQKKGFQVVACAPDEDQAVIAQLHKYNIIFAPIKLERTKIGLFGELLTCYQLYKLFRQHHPEIVISYNIKPVIYSSISARLAGVNSIYSVITGLGYVFIGQTIQVRILRFFVKHAYKLALFFNEKIFFLNADDQKLFCDNKLVNEQQTLLINGEGVDLEYYAPKPFPNVCTFLFIGRFIKDKGIYEYLLAAREIKKKYPLVLFKLVGCYDSNPAAIEQSYLLDFIVEGTVKNCGFLDDIRPVLTNSSVFVLPSYREGIPRSVLEAMSMGRPIITTDAPGCRETVRDKVNGFLVAIKDVHGLVDAMEKFIINQALIVQMGQESRRIAEEKYDVNKVNDVILAAVNV